MTTRVVKNNLKVMPNAVLIGNKNEREDFYPAIVRMNKQLEVVTYDYELLAECFAKKFSEDDDMDHPMNHIEEAYEWIDYNVLRSLPYCGPHAPIIR